MTTFANGQVPSWALVTLDTGNGRHLSSAKGAAMWYALRRNVQAKYGKTLHISSGMNGYRDLAEQRVGRDNACAAGNCNGAASPGYSSHGGTWNSAKYTGGQWVDAMAFDIGDYSQIGQAAFYAEAEAVGFRAGLITPELAGIFEPWHIIVFNPFGAIPAGLDSKDFDMPLNQDTDYEAFKNMMWRFLKYDSRDAAPIADGKYGPTAFERWNAAANAAPTPPTAAAIADAVLDEEINAEGAYAGRKTNLRSALAWNDDHVISTQKLIAAVTNAGVDPDALAAAIAAKIVVPSGASPADIQASVQAGVAAELARVFRVE